MCSGIQTWKAHNRLIKRINFCFAVARRSCQCPKPTQIRQKPPSNVCTGPPTRTTNPSMPHFVTHFVTHFVRFLDCRGRREESWPLRPTWWLRRGLPNFALAFWWPPAKAAGPPRFRTPTPLPALKRRKASHVQTPSAKASLHRLLSLRRLYGGAPGAGRAKVFGSRISYGLLPGRKVGGGAAW